MSEELSFEELKQSICDERFPLGTDELLSYFSGYFNDEEIAKVIDQHIEGLDEHWRWTIKVQEVLNTLENLSPIVHKLHWNPTDDGEVEE